MNETFTDKIINLPGRWLILFMIAVFLLFTADSCDSATSSDESLTNDQLMRYKQNGQDVPKFDWSQYRETLISIERARTSGTATTSFFFLPGVDHPVRQCDSIGYPVPATQQITNPDQYMGSSGAVIGQMEPNGTYTGDSTGTFVVCVNNGVGVPEYFEGFIHTEGGPAKWDGHQVVTTGPATVQTKTKR